MRRRVARWQAAIPATLVLAAVGLANRTGTLLLAAVVPLAYVGYGAVTAVGSPESVTVRRSVEPTTAAPGRLVDVELSVEHDGERPLSDLRVVDAVPAELAVVEGSPRAGLALDAGETTTLSYTLVARRGEYDFGSPACRLRDSSASHVESVDLDPRGDDRLVCALDADAPPISDEGREYVGNLTTDEPGRGVEFHSTREYHHGDPAARIDWRHYAKQNRLATVNYDRRVSATVILAIDARPVNRAVPAPGRPSAIELTAYAATQALTELLQQGHEVGVAVLGLNGDGPGGLSWLSPGSGTDHRNRGTALIESALDGDGAAERTEEQVRNLVELLPPGSQATLFSPLLDDGPVDAVRTLAAFDLPVTVLSPEVVADNTVSGRFASVRRRTRLAACQSTGVRTIDWRRGTPLQVVLEQAFVAGARIGGRPAGRPRTGAPVDRGGGR